MTNPVLIAPSLLSADFSRLEEDIRRVEEAGADLLHLDIMDGHFVPNLTMGPALCASLRRRLPDVLLDVHLMVTHPMALVDTFAEAGADHLTIHVEADDDPQATMEAIKAAGMTAGIAINPPTALEAIDGLLEEADLVLVMSVNPGFGGQSFIPGTLNKLREARARIDASGLPIRLEIDGGVKVDNIADIAAAGADTFVAGSAIFNAHQASDPHGYDSVIQQMRAELAKVR